MSVTLKDKAVLIAGATSEIGKQVTAELLAAGARCEITFHSDAALAELFAFLKGRGLPAFQQPLIPIKLNNFNQSQVIWGPVAAQRDFGRLELMVNLLDTQPETRELDSVQKLTAAALPLMKKRGAGIIVHIAENISEAEKYIQPFVAEAKMSGVSLMILASSEDLRRNPGLVIQKIMGAR